MLEGAQRMSIMPVFVQGWRALGKPSWLEINSPSIIRTGWMFVCTCVCVKGLIRVMLGKNYTGNYKTLFCKMFRSQMRADRGCQ